MAEQSSNEKECGVIGISTPHGEGVAQLTFFGLFALQHRGQEAAGIAVSDGHRARVAQAARTGVQRLHERGPEATVGLSRHRPHPLFHDGVEQRTQHPAVPRRDDARPAGARAQRQHRQHVGAARRAAVEGLRVDGDQRLGSDDADAGGSRRQDVGGADRAHVARVEGRLLARAAGRRPGRGRARPMGLPATVGGPPAARRLRRRQRDVRAVDARVRRHQRGRAR